MAKVGPFSLAPKPEGAIHKILTTKGFESGLNQLRDSIAKLTAAIEEAGRRLKALKAEEGRLNAEALVWENIRKLKKCESHFKAMCSSWESVSSDHAECIRLLSEVKLSGVNMQNLFKVAGINPETLFGTVAGASYTMRHNAIGLIHELSVKPGLFGNIFYKANSRPVAMPNQSDFKKAHAFGGMNFNGR